MDELPVDGETSAWALSLGLHLVGLVLLTSLTLLIPGADRFVLSSTPPDLEEELLPEDFRFSDEMENEIGALADAGAGEAEAAAPLEAEISEIVIPMEPVSFVGDVQAFEIEDPLLQGPQFDENLNKKGVGSVGATGASGAVDRITVEVLQLARPTTDARSSGCSTSPAASSRSAKRSPCGSTASTTNSASSKPPTPSNPTKARRSPSRKTSRC